MSRLTIIISLFFSLPFVTVFLGVLLFIPANTVEWLEAWLYILQLLLYLIFTFIYFLIYDPSTLEKRGKLSSSGGDNIWLSLYAIVFLLGLILPGFDFCSSSTSSSDSRDGS